MNTRAGLVAILLAFAATPVRAQQAAPTPPDFPRGKISGYFFADWYDNLAGDPRHAYNASGVDSGQVNIDGSKVITRDLNGFQLRRAYFQLDNDLSAKYATRFRLEADNRSLTSDGKVGVAVKAAYMLVRNVYPRADLYFGILSTPMFENSESYWGYRSIEKTIADFRGVMPSSDQGVVLKGFADPDHRLGYTAFVTNGPGNKPETNRQKRYGVALPTRWKNLRVEPYADYEDVWGHKDRATYKVFAGYDLPKHASIGWETVEQVQHAAGGPSKQLLGHSVFARIAPRPELAAFARVDLWDPDHRAANRVTQQLWIAGLDWQPVKDVHVMPNLEALQYGAEGTAVAPPHHDLQARITFYYLFSRPQS
jgi:hypothetical protein